MSRPISSKANRNVAWFFAIFAIAGFAFLFLFFILPLCKIVDAMHWVATPCEITRSSVRTEGGDHDTYSVDLAYTYTVAGRHYTGTRYHFSTGSSSGYAGKAAVVALYPPGKKTICYVNPRDPADAVIQRGLTPDLWAGLIPMVFVIAGILGIVFNARAKNRRQEQFRAWKPPALRNAADFTAIDSGTRELKPAATPLGKLLGVTFVAFFWNAIVSIFVTSAVQSWRNGHPTWFMNIFLIPFVLVGVGLIFWIGYSFLALFNPRMHLKITPGAVALGDSLSLEWTLEGRASALADLAITLEGSEQATYQSGENTNTARNTFRTIELVNTTNPADFASGRAQAALPRDSMHSLDTGHNKILWQLRVRGKIPGRPKLSEDYPLVILPLRKGVAS